jgi:hypothetical protein
VTPSLVQDVVLATSVRELRAVLLTDNGADFASIRRHLSGSISLRLGRKWKLRGQTTR